MKGAPHAIYRIVIIPGCPSLCHHQVANCIQVENIFIEWIKQQEKQNEYANGRCQSMPMEYFHMSHLMKEAP